MQAILHHAKNLVVIKERTYRYHCTVIANSGIGGRAARQRHNEGISEAVVRIDRHAFDDGSLLDDSAIG
jgi:hypothetical protein